MKALLINPPNNKIINSELPKWLNQTVGVFPPLGLMYIASYMRANTNYEVRILDAFVENMPWKQIKNFVIGFSPDVIGITVFTHSLIDVIYLVKNIKKILPRVHICLGGIHAKVFPKQAIQIPGVDSVISGEGEALFTELVSALEKEDSLSEIKGLIFKSNNGFVFTEAEENNINLEDLPFPDRGLIDLKRYYHVAGEKTYLATMLSSRGCPYRCSFCSVPDGDYRTRSAKNVVDEMEECIRLGLKEVYFLDDVFNKLPERVLEICDEIAERDLKVQWSFRGRIDSLNKNVLSNLKKTGCVRINLGVETSTDEGLKMLSKGITVKQIKEVFELTKAVGIETVAYFMIGCPHEKNKSDVKKTIKFACDLHPNLALFNILTLYPSTEIYRRAIEKGLVKDDCWDNFVMNPQEAFKPPVWDEYLSREELIKLIKFAYRRFYLRPGILFQNLFKTLSLESLKRKFKVLFNIIKG